MSGLIIPLIMCGGAGTRLWPASREDRPKQFLRLFGSRSTFQETLCRVSEPGIFDRPIIITNHRYRFLVAEQIAEIGLDADILVEPLRRDSAPAIIAGTIYALRQRNSPVMLAVAADHVISDVQAFVADCLSARKAADEGYIVTFGVPPDRPSSAYGYIRRGKQIGESIFVVDKFIEKPDDETARTYVQAGYLWNSGNFMYAANTLIEEYREFDPKSEAAVRAAVDGSTVDLNLVILASKDFANAKAMSIDYAVLEKTARAAVVPVNYHWSDVGSWRSVWELAQKDAAGNAAQGQAIFIDSEQSYVNSDKALVTLFGVSGLVVISTEDAVMIANQDSVGGMRRLVEHLKKVNAKITEDHLRVYRPWGYYHSLDQGTRHQVKRILVKPGGRLSLQMHHHRAEHWVVVRGTARVTVGNEVKELHENESTYIPIGVQHRLENPGRIDLELIEVQTGSYLGEDDIVRLDDDYRRR